MSDDENAAAVDQDAMDQALLNTLVTSLILTAVFLFLFHLCKHFKRKYYHRNPLHPNDRGPFGWFTKTIRYPLTKILWRQGYDAYVILSVIKLYMLLILIFAFFSLIILIPINATGHNQYRPDNVTLINRTDIRNETIDRAECVCSCVSNYNETSYPVNGTALITLANVYDNPRDSGRIYAHAISVIWNTVWTWILLFLAWRRFRNVRQTFRAEPKVHSYTVKLWGYDHKKWTEASLKTYLESIFGAGSVYAIHTVPCGPGLNKLRFLRKKRFAVLQDVEGYKYALSKKDEPETKQNLRIATERLNKIDKQIVGLMNKTDPWTYSFAEKMKHKKGCCKPITYWCARRKGRGQADVAHVNPPELVNNKDMTPDPENTTNVTFVTFRRMKDARMCAQSYLAPNPHFHVDPAPVPADVRWQNFKAPEHHIKTKCFSLLGVVVYFLLALLWFIPVAFAVSLTSLSALGRTFSFLRPITDGLDSVPVIRGFVSGLFPQLIIILFFILLIPIIKKIADIFWHPDSNSGVDIKVLQAYFCFLVINIYLGGIIANTFLQIWTQIAEITASPFLIVSILAVSIPAQSNFFLNYVLAVGLLKAVKSIGRLVGAAIYTIKDKMAHTPRQKYMMTEPDQAKYGSNLATHNLIMLLAFTYSTITPLMMPIALLYFACFYLSEKYSILFHTRQVNESGGWYWPTAFSQMCLALCVYHIIMLGIFIGITHIFGIVVCVILLLITILFWYWINQEWRPLTYHSTLADIAPQSPQDIDQMPEDHTYTYKHPMISPLEPMEREWGDHVEEALDRGDGSSMRCTRIKLASPNSKLPKS